MALADLLALATVRVAPVAPATLARGNTCDGLKREEIRAFSKPVARVAPVAPENGTPGRDEAAALPCGIAEASPGRLVATEAPETLVERLALALAVPRPWERVSGPEGPALAYYRGEARRRLDRLDGLARGLLVQAEEAEARRWAALAVHAKGSR